MCDVSEISTMGTDTKQDQLVWHSKYTHVSTATTSQAAKCLIKPSRGSLLCRCSCRHGLNSLVAVVCWPWRFVLKPHGSLGAEPGSGSSKGWQQIKTRKSHHTEHLSPPETSTCLWLCVRVSACIDVCVLQRYAWQDHVEVLFVHLSPGIDSSPKHLYMFSLSDSPCLLMFLIPVTNTVPHTLKHKHRLSCRDVNLVPCDVLNCTTIVRHTVQELIIQ